MAFRQKSPFPEGSTVECVESMWVLPKGAPIDTFVRRGTQLKADHPLVRQSDPLFWKEVGGELTMEQVMRGSMPTFSGNTNLHGLVNS